MLPRISRITRKRRGNTEPLLPRVWNMLYSLERPTHWCLDPTLHSSPPAHRPTPTLAQVTQPHSPLFSFFLSLALSQSSAAACSLSLSQANKSTNHELQRLPSPPQGLQRQVRPQVMPPLDPFPSSTSPRYSLPR